MDKKEQIDKAIEILANHNKWRKGADTPHTEPKDLTFAIDTVIAALSHLQKPVDSDAVHAYDFAHWLLCNYNTSEEGMSLCWCNADTHSKHDTLELLHQFKQLKK